jgi:hypothetical protein
MSDRPVSDTTKRPPILPRERRRLSELQPPVPMLASGLETPVLRRDAPEGVRMPDGTDN